MRGVNVHGPSAELTSMTGERATSPPCEFAAPSHRCPAGAAPAQDDDVVGAVEGAVTAHSRRDGRCNARDIPP